MPCQEIKRPSRLSRQETENSTFASSQARESLGHESRTLGGLSRRRPSAELPNVSPLPRPDERLLSHMPQCRLQHHPFLQSNTIARAYLARCSHGSSFVTGHVVLFCERASAVLSDSTSRGPEPPSHESHKMLPPIPDVEKRTAISGFHLAVPVRPSVRVCKLQANQSPTKKKLETRPASKWLMLAWAIFVMTTLTSDVQVKKVWLPRCYPLRSTQGAPRARKGGRGPFTPCRRPCRRQTTRCCQTRTSPSS